jgi:hypothetical protein
MPAVRKVSSIEREDGLIQVLKVNDELDELRSLMRVRILLRTKTRRRRSSTMQSKTN